MGLQKEKEEEQLLSSVYVGVHINEVEIRRWSIVKERLRTLRAPYMRDKLKQDKEWRWDKGLPEGSKEVEQAAMLSFQ